MFAAVNAGEDNATCRNPTQTPVPKMSPRTQFTRRHSQGRTGTLKVARAKDLTGPGGDPHLLLIVNFFCDIL